MTRTTLLVHCAKAVMDDWQSAGELLKEIQQHASPTGDATQWLAYWFAEGSEVQLIGIGRQVSRTLKAKGTSAVAHAEAYQLFLSSCCFRKVFFLFAKRAIFNAVVGRSRLHRLWLPLRVPVVGAAALAGSRDGGPPAVRITRIDLPQAVFHPEKTYGGDG